MKSVKLTITEGGIIENNPIVGISRAFHVEYPPPMNLRCSRGGNSSIILHPMEV